MNVRRLVLPGSIERVAPSTRKSSSVTMIGANFSPSFIAAAYLKTSGLGATVFRCGLGRVFGGRQASGIRR